jgi:hypothetical protein
VVLEPAELITIKRYDFFDILRTEPSIAVKLLWQFLGVVSEWLDRTSEDLSKAVEVIEAEDISDEVTSEKPAELEPELDPFAPPSMDPALEDTALQTRPPELDAALAQQDPSDPPTMRMRVPSTPDQDGDEDSDD